MRRPTRTLAPLFLCLLVSAAQAAPPAPKPTDVARYGIYMQKQRIGGLVTKTFNAKYANKPALRMESDTDIKMVALGTPVEQNLRMVYFLTPTGKPLQSTMSISSSGRTTKIVAKYEAQRVVCDVDAAGQKTQKIVPIPKGVTLVSDPDLEKGKTEQIKVGTKKTLHFFEPMTMTIQKVETEVVKKETRTIKGKPTTVFQMKSTNSFAGGSQSWVDANGRLLEDNNSLGLRMVREDLGAAIASSDYTPPGDFAVATSVKTAVKLPEARKTGMLKVKISGVPDQGLVLSDARQQVVDRQEVDGKWTITYQIQSRELPGTALPLAATTAAGPGLGDATYLGIGDPTIQKQAKALVDGETDRALIARRVRAWVKGHMQRPSNIGTPRGATEIMQSRDGVCRDYATLFAAVARAAGVPTRICSGIVYFQDGFFYHAWVECQLQDGDNGWYAFDPTLDNDFVDATHIKFAQGDPTEMFSAVRIVGQIKAEIVEYK